MDKISLLLPFRGHEAPEQRLIKLRMLFQSIDETTKHKDRCELIMCVDENDRTMQAACREAEMLPISGTTVIEAGRKYPTEKWNICQKYASGDLYMVIGDDIVFQSEGWDERTREEINKFPNKIGVAYSNDMHWIKGQLCTNHVVHKKWVETVGYWMYPETRCYYTDTVITELGKAVGKTFMQDVIIEHNHPCRKDIDVKKDPIYTWSNQNFAHDKEVFERWKKEQMQGDIDKLIKARDYKP